jgi:aspartate aminotransferase
MTSRPFQPLARDTIRALDNSLIREVANAGMGRSDIAAFWFGESDRPTADFIRAAAIRAIEDGETFYSQNLGRPYLREAIATYLSNLHGRDIGADRVAAVGSGVSALMIASQAIVAPGDRVVAVTPLWPNVVEIPKILGAEVTRVPLAIVEGSWRLDLDRLLDALTPDTRLAIVNSPNNPTGWTIEPAELDTLIAHCRKHGIWLLADDVYERLVYDPALRSAPSVLARYEAGDRIISTNSVSKAWSMTGWRLGWIVAPPALMTEMPKLVEYNTSCIFEPVQRAATAAISQGEAEVAALLARLGESRRLLVDGLRAIPGVNVPEAGGAMYAFFSLEGVDDTLDFAKRLVAEAGLGLAPGEAFGPEGRGWLRWCHAVTPARIADGLDRLGRFVGRSA